MIDPQSIRPGSVNVLIGPNGSGKSRLLRKLCTSFLRRGETVIAIAPTIYDRFLRMPKRGLRFFGARQGRAAAPNVIRNALERAATGELQIIKNLTQALKYTHFDPVVGLEVRNLDLARFDNAMEGPQIGDDDEPPQVFEPLPASEKESLFSALVKWQKQFGDSGVAQLGLDSHSFSELDALSFAKIVQHERMLRRSGTVSRVGYHLFRNRESFPLLQACSGELAFITTIAFISTQIERHSVIAIDEPDTSLHPTWQQSYVKTLLDLFHRYEPRILISTHSPIIISGAEAASGAISVFEMKNGEANIFDHAKLSLEEMYDRLFGLITPKNHYLSQRAVSLLNELNTGDRNLNQVVHELEELRAKSYDESQQGVITRFEELARKLDVMKVEDSK